LLYIINYCILTVNLLLAHPVYIYIYIYIYILITEHNGVVSTENYFVRLKNSVNLKILSRILTKKPEHRGLLREMSVGTDSLYIN